MKPAFAFVLVMALCAQLYQVSGGNSPKLTSSPSVTSTTTKPWTQRFKDGLGTFLQGAAVVGAVQQGLHNARGSGKHKSIGHATSASINSKH